MKKSKVIRKRKIKFRNLFFLCSFFLCVLGIGLYIYKMPMKNIIITGTTYVTDQEIIEQAGIKNYPPLFQISRKLIKESLLEIDFIKDVKVKRNLFGVLSIEVVEEIPLFYNRNNEKLIFKSGKEIATQDLKGCAILVNFVPDEIYQRLLKEMAKTDISVLKLISEMEYQPWKSEDVMIDDTRFFFRMNDGNVLYVNLINFDKLNNYMTIYSELGDEKGILQLDSSLGNGITFTPYG